MSNGNTLIGNSTIVGPGLNPKAKQGDAYLEDAVIQEAEDQLMDGEVTSEEEDMAEHQMLNAALVNSVEDSTTKTPPGEGDGGSGKAGDDSKQHYSLRRRRSPTGETTSAPASPSTTKAAIISSATKPLPPPAAPTAKIKADTTMTPATGLPGKAVVKIFPSKGKATSHVRTPASTSKPSSPRTRTKTETVPAITVPAPAAPLSIPITMSASSLPKTSSLPLALQPHTVRQKPLTPPAPKTKPAARPKAGTKAQQKRLASVAGVKSPARSLEPTPVAGVPNPLSNPLPMSKSILVTKQSKNKQKVSHAGAPSRDVQNNFNTGNPLTVPCPLPPSSFDSAVERKNSQEMPPPASLLEINAEKKKVTIAPESEVNAARGRIFSIDLDPASLDFSILDSGESGTLAPVSADLPLMTGGPRDRAFSFECFAFGISADETLPMLSEGSTASASEARQQEILDFLRPRGDSIIFDPVSFQEGGIHEEHALTTRESRGMSMDLDAVILNSSASAPPPAVADARAHSGARYFTAPVPAPDTSTSSTHPRAGGRARNHQSASGHHTYPDSTHSNAPDGSATNQRHTGHHYSPLHQASYANASALGQGQTGSHVVTSNTFSQDTNDHSAAGIVGSCATSQALQMELLNKDGRIGIYLPEARRERIARFHAKRKMRIWRKRIKYDCRKKLADSRPRIKGRFVKRVDD